MTDAGATQFAPSVLPSGALADPSARGRFADDRVAYAGPAPVAAFVKRVFDVGFALALLLVLTPTLLLIYLIVLVADGRPVLFRQDRVGLSGRLFAMYKFRTFPVDHVDDVHSRPLSDCPSRLGRLLRRTSLDELPQLFNVIRGDMSVVGPRPERPHFVSSLESDVPSYAQRHRVRGGITGLAQIRGYWGQTDLAERVRLDNEYIDDWSLRQELGILLRTVPAVLRKLST